MLDAIELTSTSNSNPVKLSKKLKKARVFSANLFPKYSIISLLKPRQDFLLQSIIIPVQKKWIQKYKRIIY